jgi:hypothetical protein
MEDRSIIRPILDALDYFNSSPEETNYFYNIIDKFSAYWFGKIINVNNLNNVEMLLIHELLGEYIRFEENSKRVALWLLSINRICYNFSNDLSSLVLELEKINHDENQDIDVTLIEPILKQIQTLDAIHKKAGKESDRGEGDLITNYLQWVMVYASIIYPSLNNKLDFYTNTIIKSMNFILMEFIKQRSNDKRMAYLVMGIIEACNQYNIQNENYVKEFIENYPDREIVLAGQEEALVKELLLKLKDEKIKQRENRMILQDTAPEEYVVNTYKKLISELNSDSILAVTNFNKYILRLTSKILSYNDENKSVFLSNILDFDSDALNNVNSEIIEKLRKSMSLLPEKTKNWINKELAKLNQDKKGSIDRVVNSLKTKEFASKFNYMKPFVLLYLSYKFQII